MFIKQITICGFKSYKNKTVIDDFHNGLNIIVGRNGSGKSNVFAAIEFALTLEYRYMKPEARNALLFQGRASQEPAYVEVVFDNADRKLPVGEATVTFRRVLASKKDKLFINGKEMIHAKPFLDVAGFTNPYFIVKQGKINDLALASDALRLKMISDVLGTSVFDIQILDCKQNLEAADSKTKDIARMVKDLEARKEALEAEVAEQKKYLKQDRARRAIELVLHEREVEDVRNNLAEVQTSRDNAVQLQEPKRAELERVSREIQSMKHDITEINLTTSQLKQLNTEYQISLNYIRINLAKQMQELNDLRNKMNSSSAVNLCLPTELQTEISKKKNQLTELEKELELSKKTVDTFFNEKCQLDVRNKEIADKQHRKGTFKNATEYQKHLNSKLKEVQQRLSRSEAEHKAVELDCTEAGELLRQENTNLQGLHECVSTIGNDINTLSGKVKESKMEQNILKNRLECTWREISEIEQKIAQQKVHNVRGEEEHRKYFGAAILEGWKGIKKVIEDFRNGNVHLDVLNGYFGLLCENIICEPPLNAAVEVAAGKKLLYHVVQSRVIAKTILREFNKQNLRGEVNFIPLDGLEARANLDLANSTVARPIISLLDFDQRIAPVAKFVFGSTLLCDSLASATEMMRRHKVQCVTTDGEKVSKVGAISGGYNRYGLRKMELQRVKTANDKKLEDLQKNKATLDMSSGRLNDEFKECKRKHEQFCLQKTLLEAKISKIFSDIKTADKKIGTLKGKIEGKEKIVSELNTNLNVLREKKKILEAELSGLEIPDESTTMSSFRTAACKYTAAFQTHSAKQKEASRLESEVKHLWKQLCNHFGPTCENDQGACEKDSVKLEELIRSLEKQSEELQYKIDDTHRNLMKLDTSVKKKQGDLEILLEKEERLQKELQVLCAKLESLASGHQHFLEKLQDNKSRAAKLGSMPVDLSSYEKLRNKELLQKLEKLNLKLKNKVEVNQKAIQQHEELTKTLDSFENQMTSYENDRKDIALILRDLENKKGDAMLQNIRLLQEQFKEIFCSIVPLGNVELILYGKNVSVDQNADINDDNLKEMAGQNTFEGVKINVNFLGKQLSNMRDLARLSGGQKSIVALSLVLAIQTIDPVPFYLFDEVDQALDSAYRESVARVIANMSERSQFVCTTFRRELVAVADKVFGVSYHSKNSSVQQISDTQALDFVENELSSNETSSISFEGSFRPQESTAAA